MSTPTDPGQRPPTVPPTDPGPQPDITREREDEIQRRQNQPPAPPAPPEPPRR